MCTFANSHAALTGRDMQYRPPGIAAAVGAGDETIMMAMSTLSEEGVMSVKQVGREAAGRHGRLVEGGRAGVFGDTLGNGRVQHVWAGAQSSGHGASLERASGPSSRGSGFRIGSEGGPKEVWARMRCSGHVGCRCARCNLWKGPWASCRDV